MTVGYTAGGGTPLVGPNGENVNSANPVAVADFFLEVAKGNVPGHSVIRKFAENGDIDSNVVEDVWQFGGIKSYLTGPTTLYASSSSALDTQEITITGLDDIGLLQNLTVNLTGQTQVALPGLWTAAFSGFNSDSTNLAGNVYVAEADTTTGGVPDTPSKVQVYFTFQSQQTLQSQFKIPSNTKGFFYSFSVSIQKNTSASVVFEILTRELGGVFRSQAFVGCQEDGSSSFIKSLEFPAAIQPSADIVVRALSPTNGVSVSMIYEILLVDTNLLP